MDIWTDRQTDRQTDRDRQMYGQTDWSICVASIHVEHDLVINEQKLCCFIVFLISMFPYYVLICVQTILYALKWHFYDIHSVLALSVNDPITKGKNVI